MTDIDFLLREADKISASNRLSIVTSLAAAIRELRADAERYRWLRGQAEDYCGHACFPEVRYRNGLHDGFEAKTVDEAVDAARGAP